MTIPSAPDSLDAFVALSAILTGIAEGKLQPALDTHGTAEAYLTYAIKNGGAEFANLMRLYGRNSTQPTNVIADLILKQSGQEMTNMAQAVMLMWYLGSWYQPAALADYVKTCRAALPTATPQFLVISSDAYTQGWAWRVGQTHPMGYSDLRFGYWNAAPQPLADFVGKAQ